MRAPKFRVVALLLPVGLAAPPDELYDGAGRLAGPGEEASDAGHDLRLGSRPLDHTADSGLASMGGLRGHSLMQVGSHRQGTAASVHAASGASSKAKAPLDVGWFSGYSQDESTYNAEVDTARGREGSWEEKRDDPYRRVHPEPAVFFHESRSAGPKAAWQTHYPALQQDTVNHGFQGAWHVNAGGEWKQDYVFPVKDTYGPLHSDWFEAGIGQYDGYGRPKKPDTELFWYETYLERSVNTTLECDTPGCTASTNLQAFDGERENAINCKLSLHVHPTDFDDQYSGERLTFIKVNGLSVNTDCFPMMSGCSPSSQVGYFSCLNELPLESIIDSSGLLNISAQISDTVDECPFQGNLLSAVPVVTCMVAEKVVRTTSFAPALPVLRGPFIAKPQKVHVEVPIHCAYRGCMAHAHLALGDPNEMKQFKIRSCALAAKVYQTDFDGEQGTLEQLEFFKIDDKPLKSARIKPGRNPCRSKWAGTPLPAEHLEHSVISNHDVTQIVERQQTVSVAVKITDHVDECAHDGYLLDGLVEMDCWLIPLYLVQDESLANQTANETEAANQTEVANETEAVNASAANDTYGAANATAGTIASLLQASLEEVAPPTTAAPRPWSLRDALRATSLRAALRRRLVKSAL